jgi:hypothetical protein
MVVGGSQRARSDVLAAVDQIDAGMIRLRGSRVPGGGLLNGGRSRAGVFQGVGGHASLE